MLRLTWASFLSHAPDKSQRDNKFLTKLVFSIFFCKLWILVFPVDLWPKREAHGPQNNGKNSVRNLKYGCWTRL